MRLGAGAVYPRSDASGYYWNQGLEDEHWRARTWIRAVGIDGVPVQWPGNTILLSLLGNSPFGYLLFGLPGITLLLSIWLFLKKSEEKKF